MRLFISDLNSFIFQIFDIFANPTKPKYHFKPVESSFCDATFIRPPKDRSNSTVNPSDKSERHPPEWGIYLLVMAKMGSILYQVSSIFRFSLTLALSQIGIPLLDSKFNPTLIFRRCYFRNWVPTVNVRLIHS